MLECALDEAHDVDSEAEDDAWGLEGDDIETCTSLPSPIPSRNNVCEYHLKYITLSLSLGEMRQFWWRGGSTIHDLM